jgi:hypothetical protein
LKRFWRDTKSTGVKDVKLVVRPYKTRSAFTNLSSSPPTIYLNEYLIDDEEILEYLILRELIHIKLHMYPPMRYGMPNMSYAEKFESNLYFLIPKEKIEQVKERIFKTDRGVPEARSMTSFFSILFMGSSGAVSCSAAGAKSSSGGMPSLCGEQEEGKKEAYPPAGTSLQVFAHRFNYSCEEKPAGKYLQVLAPQTHSGTTSATTSTWYILAPENSASAICSGVSLPAMPGKLTL